MDVYEYTGNNPASVDTYAIFIRRQMHAAYVEIFNGVTFLVTDYTVHSTDFKYVSRKY